MTILEEIENKTAQLSRDEFFKLVRWLRERLHDQWDRQIEEDAAAGRLDFFVREVDDEICRKPKESTKAA